MQRTFQFPITLAHALSRNTSRGGRIAKVERLEERVLLSSYYVDAVVGNDANPGTLVAPWKTIDRVNAAVLMPGDSILFEGGQTFNGNVVLKQSGTAQKPIVLGSYGTGAAVIAAGNGNGVYANNVGGIHITGLNFVGTSQTNPTYDNTVLAAPTAPGDTSITLASYKGIRPGQPIFLGRPNPETVYISRNVPASGPALLRKTTHVISAHAAGVAARVFDETPHDGILFENTSSAQIDSVQIDHVDVSGFGGVFPSAGIAVVGQNQAYGFSNVSITDSNVHDNGPTGIYVAGSLMPFAWANHNVTIARVRTYNNHFTNNADWITSQATTQGHYAALAIEQGIVVFDTQNLTIDHCVSYDNGQFSGSVGIWISRVDLGTIQYCESYGNRCGTAFDGDGIDIDGSSTHTIVQNCYTHDNDGGGITLYEFSNTTPVNLQSSLKNPPAAGDQSISVTSAGGIAPGLQLVIGPYDLNPEKVFVAAGYVPGSAVVPLTAPLAYAHVAGTLVAWPATITSAGKAGDKSIQMNVVTGLMPGQYLLIDRYGTQREENFVADDYVPGSLVVPLKTPLLYSHISGAAAQYSIVPPNRNNTIRFNVSENDGQKNGAAGITIWNGEHNNSLGIANANIYNNTIYAGATSVANVVPPTAVNIYGALPTNIRIFNNIFIADGTHNVPTLTVKNASQRSNVVFAGNDYFANGTPPTFIWNGQTYSGLAAWRAATGQETSNGINTGSQQNPHLLSPGNGGTIGNAFRLSSLSAYRATEPPPAGINLKAMGIDIGGQDFYGNATSGDLNFIGADRPIFNLPAPWTAVDVGTAPRPGSDSFDSSGQSFTLTSTANGTTGTADALHFVYEPLTGDGAIIAHLGGQSGSGEAGIMFRDSLEAQSSFAFVRMRDGKQARFKARAQWAGNVAPAGDPVNATTPQWLKLVRGGDMFTAFISADALTWTPIGSATKVSMASTAWVGIAVSGDGTNTAPAQFRAIDVVPTPWTRVNVGSASARGSVSAGSNGTLVLSAAADPPDAGANDVIPDSFNFLYQKLSGDGGIVARLADSGGLAGVMIRGTLGAASPQALLDVSPGGIAFSFRAASNGVTTSAATASASGPIWLKLTRTGNSIAALTSVDGQTWTAVGSAVSVNLKNDIYIGLASASNAPGTNTLATFQAVSVLSAGWSGADIGSPGVLGSAIQAGNAITVNASGWDIGNTNEVTIPDPGPHPWFTVDQFHFVYQPFSGDGTIVARIASPASGGGGLGLAGIMIRNSLSADAGNAFVGLSAGGVQFQYRALGTSPATVKTHPTPAAAPVWVKLVRSGGTVTAFISTDGINWGNAIGSAQISLSANLLVGLAVTSQQRGVIGSAVFDNLSIAPAHP